MFRLPVLFLLLLCGIFPLSAQHGKKPTPKDFKFVEDANRRFPDAAVVARNVEDAFTFHHDAQVDMVTANHVRTQKIVAVGHNAQYQPYSFFDDMSSIISAGATYRNKKKRNVTLQKQAVSSDEYFHTDAQVAFFNLDFEGIGWQLNTHFDKQYKDVKYLTTVYFHTDLPAIERTIKFSIPNWMEVELKEMNFEGYDISKNITKNSSEQIHTYTIKNIDVQKTENNAPGPSHILPHLLILSKSYTYNGETKNLFSCTKDLYAWYKSLIDQMKDDDTPLYDLVNELTANAINQQEKIKSIYYWIQDNIRYIAFENGIAGFKPDECQNVLNKKYGDCKGMANLCKRMLNIAGFDARLSWIGTKHIAYDYSLPTLSADNHMICTVMLDGTPIFLDPTERFGAYGEYADRIQGRPVMIEDGENFILHHVPSNSSKDNIEKINYDFTLLGEDLVGRSTRTFDGEAKSMLLYQIANTEKSERKGLISEYLKTNGQNYKIENLVYSDIDNRDQQFSISYLNTSTNKVSIFDNEIYLSLDMHNEWKGKKIESRNSGYVLPYKPRLEHSVEVTLPEGFAISENVKTLEYQTPLLSIRAGYSMKNGKLMYHKVIDIKKSTIDTSEFEAFNRGIELLTKFYDEQVVLSKTK